MRRDQKLIIILGISLLGYNLIWAVFIKFYSLGPFFWRLCKFLLYVNIFGFFNSGLYLRALAMGRNIDTFEFQKEIVIANLFFYGILVLMEIPIWLDSIIPQRPE